MNSLAEKKRALVAEADAYRQALSLDIRNLADAADGLRNTFRVARWIRPLLWMAPLAGSLIGLRSGPRRQKEPQNGWRKWAALATTGWGLYRRVAPAISHFIARRNSRPRSTRRRFGEIPPIAGRD